MDQDCFLESCSNGGLDRSTLTEEVGSGERIYDDEDEGRGMYGRSEF